jgi:hypothetical protein
MFLIDVPDNADGYSSNSPNPGPPSFLFKEFSQVSFY